MLRSVIKTHNGSTAPLPAATCHKRCCKRAQLCNCKPDTVTTLFQDQTLPKMSWHMLQHAACCCVPKSAVMQRTNGACPCPIGSRNLDHCARHVPVCIEHSHIAGSAAPTVPSHRPSHLPPALHAVITDTYHACALHNPIIRDLSSTTDTTIKP